MNLTLIDLTSKCYYYIMTDIELEKALEKVEGHSICIEDGSNNCLSPYESFIRDKFCKRRADEEATLMEIGEDDFEDDRLEDTKCILVAKIVKKLNNIYDLDMWIHSKEGSELVTKIIKEILPYYKFGYDEVIGIPYYNITKIDDLLSLSELILKKL